MVPKFGSMRTVIGIGASIALVALVSAALVFAQGPPSQSAGQMGPGMRGMGPMGRGQMGPMMGLGPMGPGMGRGGLMGPHLALGQLGLTDAQKEQVKKIVESHRTEAQDLAKEAQPAHEALRTAVEANDVNAIQAASANLGALIAKGAILRAKAHAEVFGVLTDEQKAKAKEFQAQAGQRLQRFRGMRKGPPHF